MARRFLLALSLALFAGCPDPSTDQDAGRRDNGIHLDAELDAGIHPDAEVDAGTHPDAEVHPDAEIPDTDVDAGVECTQPIDCEDGDPCTAETCVGGRCGKDDITDPIDSDGCCPNGAHANNDSDCPPVCGNGEREGTELCDDGDDTYLDWCNRSCVPTPQKVAAAWDHNCMVDAAGIVTCAGTNAATQAPNGIFLQVDAGREHTCVLAANQTIDCFGENDYGQTDSSTATDFIQVVTGDFHSCGLDITGEVTCWGSGLTVGTCNWMVPHCGQSIPPPGPFIQITAGTAHTCGLRLDGTISCWGAGGGDPANDDCWCGEVECGQSRVVTGTYRWVTAGAVHTCAISATDNTVVCWGAGTRSNPSTDECWDEVECTQSIPPGDTFARIAGGYDFTCGVRLDGTATCWGRDDGGRLDISTSTSTFAQITAGTRHGCALTPTWDQVCWGQIPGNF